MNRLGSTLDGVEDRRAARGRRAPRAAVATWRIEGDPAVVWIKLDDKFWHHPKIRALVPEHRARCGAFYVASICFGSLYETDGLVRVEDLPMLIPPDTPPAPAEIAELVRVRLWEVAEYRDVAGDPAATRHGWRVHDFLAHNMSAQARAELRKEKTANRQRQRRRRKRKDRPNPGVAEMSPATISDTPNVAPLENRDQRLEIREREKRVAPPNPPVATVAAEPTGPDRSSLSLVKNPDTPKEAPMPHPWDATSQRVTALLEHRAKVGDHDGAACEVCVRLAQEFADASEPRKGYLTETQREYLRRCREDILRQRAAESARDDDEPAP
jgi:hypothetical protein